MQLKDFLSSINHVKAYTPFVVNRCLSYFADTLFHANEMNCSPWLDNKSQFDFYRLAVRKKKRFSPWLRKDTEENVTLIKQAYGYTESKAREVLNILSTEDLQEIRKALDTGGVR